MQSNWLALVLVATLAAMGVCAARWWFQRWLNPLSIYSAIWGLCLCNYELRLIEYDRISGLAWACILVAWFSLYLGSAAVFLLRPRTPGAAPLPLVIDLNRLKKMILGLSALGAVGLVGQLAAVAREFGNPLTALVLNSGDIYSARITGELSGPVYIGDLSFAACALAGVYTAKMGRLTMVGLLPIALVTLQLMSLAGRTGLGIAAVLFVVSYAYTPLRPRFQLSKKQVALLLTASLFLMGGFVLVSSIRHLDVAFPGITPAMERISDYVPFTPSLYSNFSATPVAFSLYLASPQETRTGFWGMYTFAPIFRFLSHMGFRTSVPPYEENYYTPVPINTGTYLKNIDSDFGISGIVLFPFFLGAVVTRLILRAGERPGLAGLVLLSNVFVLVVFAFAFDFMALGDWYMSMISSVAAALIVSHGSRRLGKVSPAAAGLP
jgi:oligosaccharide repeat unit polymerase